MHTLSSKITLWLIRQKTISTEDQSLYEYATYCLLFSFSPLLLVICISVWTDMLKEGILITLPFMCIRKFSGGFHLKSSHICFISSCTLICFLLFLSTIINMGRNLYIAVFCAVISLITFSPIDSTERQLNTKEKNIYKNIIIIITLIYTSTFILLDFFNMHNSAICIALGLILSALLQIPCLLQRALKKRES